MENDICWIFSSRLDKFWFRHLIFSTYFHSSHNKDQERKDWCDSYKTATGIWVFCGRVFPKLQDNNFFLVWYTLHSSIFWGGRRWDWYQCSFLGISSMGTFTIDHIEISSLLIMFCIPLSCFYVSSCLYKKQGKCLSTLFTWNLA